MSTSGETRVLIAMDGSKYADYAFDCKYTAYVCLFILGAFTNASSDTFHLILDLEVFTDWYIVHVFMDITLYLNTRYVLDLLVTFLNVQCHSQIS